jgi:hypothetical protein
LINKNGIFKEHDILLPRLKIIKKSGFKIFDTLNKYNYYLKANYNKNDSNKRDERI